MGSNWIQGITVLLPPSEVSYNLQLSSGICILREKYGELKPVQKTIRRIIRTASEEGHLKALEVFLLEKRD